MPQMGENRVRAAVVGAAGYAGSELVRLLATHPNVEVAAVTSSRHAGTRLSDLCPWLATDLVLSSFEPESSDVEVVFLAQESGFAMQHAPGLAKNSKVIDLSADFRLKSLDAYSFHYEREHTAWGTKAVYGLPELVDRAEIAEARIVANPGCYPTSALLGLMPLVKAGLLAGTPVIDAKSGVSGAGRSRTETDYLFAELTGGFKTYSPVGHRHTPEIEQMAGLPVRFTPHLIPTARGLQSTIHAPVGATSVEALIKIFEDFYRGSTFVKLVARPPSTKQVLGSNRCDIFVTYDSRTHHAVIVSVIDNLVKGAAGQAIQNMNIMLGIPEGMALPVNGIWP